MNNILITIYPEWSSGLVDTLSEVCIMELNETNMFSLYHTLLSFSKLTHNFILDRDQLKYNSSVSKLLKDLQTYGDVNLEVQTLQYYYTGFYERHRHLLTLISEPIRDILPMLDSPNLEIKTIVVQT